MHRKHLDSLNEKGKTERSTTHQAHELEGIEKFWKGQWKPVGFSCERTGLWGSLWKLYCMYYCPTKAGRRQENTGQRESWGVRRNLCPTKDKENFMQGRARRDWSTKAKMTVWYIETQLATKRNASARYVSRRYQVVNLWRLWAQASRRNVLESSEWFFWVNTWEFEF